jgi:hypothetical protein
MLVQITVEFDQQVKSELTVLLENCVQINVSLTPRCMAVQNVVQASASVEPKNSLLCSGRYATEHYFEPVESTTPHTSVP